MKRCIFLYVVSGEREGVLELVAGKDQALLVWRAALLVLILDSAIIIEEDVADMNNVKIPRLEHWRTDSRT